jgi:hypothetical protein
MLFHDWQPCNRTTLVGVQIPMIRTATMTASLPQALTRRVFLQHNRDRMNVSIQTQYNASYKAEQLQ